MESTTREFQGLHGTFTIRRPRPGVVILEIVGHDVGEFGEAPFEELEKDLKLGVPLQMFVDARTTNGATIDVSNDWALWLRSHKTQLAHLSMLTRSKFIQLTADFVRKFSELGERMRLYTDEATFDAAVAAASRGQS